MVRFASIFLVFCTNWIRSDGAFVKQADACGSVILLSPGRTATDTISHTVVKSANIEYCHGQKEYYKDKPPPNRTTLEECIDSNKKTGKGGTYLHVKPQHIMKGPRNSTHSKRAWLLKHKKILISPEYFFKLAKQVGFGLVVISYRDNLLARTISSYELSVAEHHYDIVAAERLKKDVTKVRVDEVPEMVSRAAVSFNDHLIKRWELETHSFNQAAESAAQAGFKMIQIEFKQIVSDVCGSAQTIAEMAGCPMPFNCIELDGHTQTSHRKRTLSERIGTFAAEKVQQLLMGTPYEWMLDLSATEWPPGVQNPVPLFKIDNYAEAKDPVSKLPFPAVTQKSAKTPPALDTENKAEYDHSKNKGHLKPDEERLKFLQSLIPLGMLTETEFNAVKLLAENHKG